jgi:DNA adenine methylase
MSKFKTPISYYGGKINMLKHILPLIPPHKIYTESFFGGGAVFFAKEPALSEIINDSNNIIVTFYEVCKTDFENLKQKIEATPFSRASYKVALTIYRMPHLFSKLQIAWAFYIATQLGFASKVGSFGYSRYASQVKAFQKKKISFTDDIVKRLENTQIESHDACQVIKSRDAEDAFHYVDPPYINSNQGHYDGYTEADYQKLLNTLSNIKGKFLLSSYPSEILQEYIEKNNWYIKSFDKPLSAKKVQAGETRPRKTEVLVANYAI